jgi:DNA-directed RNA polymerase I, II, and III subunit RPABC1
MDFLKSRQSAQQNSQKNVHNEGHIQAAHADFCYYFFDRDGNSCLTYFVRTEKDSTSTSIDVQKNFLAILGMNKTNSGIMIAAHKLTAKARNILSDIQTKKSTIQFFLEDELMYDPTDTVWGSKTEALSPFDRDKFLEQNKIDSNKMPRINLSDPVIKYLGLQKGDIVVQKRKAIIPGTIVKTSLFYRCVV